MNRILVCLAIFAGALLFASISTADEIERVRFADPVRIEAGGKFVGEGRYYPSPVLHDVNGDKRPDLLVADLMGRVTVALRADGKEPAFLEEKPLLGRDGKPLKFHNW